MKTGQNNQAKLEHSVSILIKAHGEEEAIKIIKNSTNQLFNTRQHYPNGVYIFCNSEKGGLLIGTDKK